MPEKVLARPEIEKIFFLASAKKANDDEVNNFAEQNYSEQMPCICDSVGGE